ncbi:hypothetical protein JCM19046_3505 [Bacillus sp. JCM 19046]|nr:hypothetical protein JCM19045_4271 [Bacillus sp. JCM 19045]GAF18894.1 hypothetical protein JCM19046_3505 [Bacillus sp. JCM 19046]
MKMEIENQKLVATHDFMYKLELVRKKSRARRELCDIIKERTTKNADTRKKILEEHSHKDEEGNAIIEDDNYQIKDIKLAQEDLNEFNKETLVIEGGEHRELLRTLRTIFEGLEEKEFGAEESEIYDYLYDQLDKNEEEKGAEE